MSAIGRAAVSLLVGFRFGGVRCGCSSCFVARFWCRSFLPVCFSFRLCSVPVAVAGGSAVVVVGAASWVVCFRVAAPWFVACVLRCSGAARCSVVRCRGFVVCSVASCPSRSSFWRVRVPRLLWGLGLALRPPPPAGGDCAGILWQTHSTEQLKNQSQILRLGAGAVRWGQTPAGRRLPQPLIGNKRPTETTN